MRNPIISSVLSLKIVTALYFLALSACPVFPQTFHNLRSTENLTVRGFVQDESGMMWFVAGKTLFGYDGYAVHSFNSEELDASGLINCCTLNGGHIVMGCEHGLVKFDVRSRQMTKVEELDGVNVRAIAVDDGDEWLGTDRGLFLNTTKVMKDVEILSVLPKDNYIYIGSRSGLLRYNTISHETEFVGEDHVPLISCLAIAPNNRDMYVGTPSRLMRYHSYGANHFSQEATLPVVKSICTDCEGRLLVGTDNGLYIKDKQGLFNPVVHDARNDKSLAGDAVWAVFQDRDNNLWFGTDNGVSIYEYSRRVKIIPLSSITGRSEGNRIYCMMRDSMGHLWIGGTHGIIRISHFGEPTQSFVWYKMNDQDYPIPHNKIRAIWEDSRTGIWLGGDGGLLRYNEAVGQFERYFIHGDKNNWVYGITGKNGRLKINTYDGSYDIDLNLAEGHLLVPANIYGKQALRESCSLTFVKGRKWWVDAEGLVIEDPDTGQSRNIRLSDNFVSVYYDSYSGKVFLGGADKLAIVEADAFDYKDQKRDIAITDIKAGGADIDDYSQIYKGEVRLQYDQNDLLISFSDFRFSQEKTDCYAFRIEGRQPNWVRLKTGQNSILLTNMRPGKYKLYVSDAYDIKSGNTSISPILTIHIRPVWYLSPWAWALYVVLFAMLACLFVRHYIQRRKLKYECQERDRLLATAKQKEALLENDNEILQRKFKVQMLSGVEANKDISQDERFLLNVTKIIEDNIENPELSVSSLCKLSGFSCKQMYRKVKQLTGMTTVEYIRSLRMKKAAILLYKKNFSIAEVMNMVGFSNASYFTRCFVAEYKMTPTEYQNKNNDVAEIVQ